MTTSTTRGGSGASGFEDAGGPDGRDAAGAPVPDGANGSRTRGRTVPASGELLVCATPIGNSGDVTARVVDALSSADAIYAEDTRVTRKLLYLLGIEGVEVLRCDENATERVLPQIVEKVRSGQVVAFVSDAGMPCISDPGQRVVARMREEDLPVTVLPGASAVATAVAGCGFAGTAFYFGGFFPRKTGERRRTLEALSGLDAMLVFYESNHRTVSALRAIAEVFPQRRVCMARELTKVHEEYTIDYPAALADAIEAREGELKGEVVLVIEPPSSNGGVKAVRGMDGAWSVGQGDGRDDGRGAGQGDGETGAVGADAIAVAGAGAGSGSGEGSGVEVSVDAAIAARAAELSVQDGMNPSKVAKVLQREFGITRDIAYDAARRARRGA